MHVLVRASVVVAVATALGSLDRGPVDPAPVVVPPAKARGIDGMPAPCGRGTLPEGDVCVALPKAAEGSVAASAGAREAKLPPRLRSGLEVAQEIPKLPDRP
ncbi:MAG TPA: hypothetical protein VHB21_25105, partial [Minicystis sp.]|nr:hypothetical protein [Minicystis sp.]